MPTILVAEDNPDDATLLRWAFRKSGSQVRLDFASDGLETIHCLQHPPCAGGERWCARPNLLMLDLKMPRLDGFGVLEALAHSPALRPPHVVVFTSCSTADELSRCCGLGVDHYFVKPCDPLELLGLIKRLEEYWSNADSAPEQPLEAPGLALDTVLPDLPRFPACDAHAPRWTQAGEA